MFILRFQIIHPPPSYHESDKRGMESNHLAGKILVGRRNRSRLGSRHGVGLSNGAVVVAQTLLGSLSSFASPALLIVRTGVFAGLDIAATATAAGSPAADPAAAIGGGDIGAGQT